jgi:hypothetical protein
VPTHKEIKYPAGTSHQAARRPGSRFQQSWAESVERVLDQPEADFQATVVATARQMGWKVYHTLRSDGSEEGFPDLCCVRGTRLLFIELKRVGKAPTMAQAKWLLALARVAGVECYAWDMTDADTVQEVLA